MIHTEDDSLGETPQVNEQLLIKLLLLGYGLIYYKESEDDAIPWSPVPTAQCNEDWPNITHGLMWFGTPEDAYKWLKDPR